MKKIKLYIKIALGVFAVGLLIFALIPARVPVDMDVVKRGDVLVTLDGEGKTKIHDIYVVYAPIEGRVTRIESEQGDSVTAGETVIANMKPADPHFIDSRTEIQTQADIQGAEAALGFEVAKLERAQAELDFAKAELARTQRLYDNGNVSIARLEQAQLTVRLRETELNTANSGMEVAKSTLAAAKARLVQPGTAADGTDSSNLIVRAPISGKVLRILHKSEGVIPSGTPLVEVGNPEDLEIVIEMLSRDAVKVKKGDMALIKRWGGSDDIRAQVRVVSPSGLEIRNDTFRMEVSGLVHDARLADLDKDGFPEVYAFARSTGADSTAFVYAFSSYRNRSYGAVGVRELSSRPEMARGFNGHSTFYFEDGRLKRSFPVYEQGEPTGKKRVVTYALRQGEASFILEPVSSVEMDGN